LYDLEARLPYDVPYAHRMLSLSGAAYCPSSTIAEWKCSFCSQVDEFKIYGVNYNATTDMLSFVGYDGATNTVVVSFRGTNPLSIKDWLADLNFFMTPFGSGNDCEKCQVHRGFLAAYQSIRDRTLEWMLKAKSQFPDAKIAVTGHSLGGALAMVAAMDFHLYANTTADLFYTYGQPRVGNSAFTDLFKRTFNDSTMYRLTHGLDPVPHLPPRFAGFYHPNTEVYYDGLNTHYTICDGSGEDPKCADQWLLPLGFTDHVTYLGLDFVAQFLKCNLGAERMG